MQKMVVPNPVYSASSNAEIAEEGRLVEDMSPSQAWRSVTDDAEPYLQVTFESLVILTDIKTQGAVERIEDAVGNIAAKEEFVKKFTVEFSVDDDLVKWNPVSEGAFEGNQDGISVVTNSFSKPLKAKVSSDLSMKNAYLVFIQLHSVLFHQKSSVTVINVEVYKIIMYLTSLTYNSSPISRIKSCSGFPA